MKRTVTDIRIYKQYWYVIDLTWLIKPVVIPVYFLNRKMAKAAIIKNVPKNLRKFHQPIEGSKLLEYDLPVVFNKGKWGKYTKYDYPKTRSTAQDKKNFRTIMRRRLRRMGLLTHVKPRKGILDTPDYIKHIPNTQKVATTKHSEARVFQLQRKPSHIFYFLVSSRFSETRGKLFDLGILKINIKEGTIEKGRIKTKRTDLLLPWTLTEFFNLLDNDRIKRQIKRAYREPIKAE